MGSVGPIDVFRSVRTVMPLTASRSALFRLHKGDFYFCVCGAVNPT